MIFHLGVAQWMVEHHDASFLHAEDFRRSFGLGPYQAAFHAMVATTAQLTGASVVVSASSFALARNLGKRTLATALAHVAEWQTRTAQDRMGKPVEVRLLS